jgi:hypothetical protein
VSHHRCCDECDNVLADTRGPQEVESARGIGREVHENFKKAVEVQGDQHMKVSEALEAVKPRAKQIVRPIAYVSTFIHAKWHISYIIY